MFDQTFSAANFEAIFEIELRKGLVDFNQMPQEYREAATNVKAVRAELADARGTGQWHQHQHQLKLRV